MRIKNKQKLIDTVIQHMKNELNIKDDHYGADWTAIEELLKFVPLGNLLHYLPEEQWDNHIDLKKK